MSVHSTATTDADGRAKLRRLIARTPLHVIALALAAASLATILAALAFEHIGGYQPCPLCLMQRDPHYVGILLALLGAAAAWWGAPRWTTALAFAGFAGLMGYGTGLAVYHSGVEWSWWEGPSLCAAAGASPTDSAAMLGMLRGGAVPPSCTEAVWRLLGLSFAGWNALISAALTAGGLYGLARSWRRTEPR